MTSIINLITDAMNPRKNSMAKGSNARYKRVIINTISNNIIIAGVTTGRHRNFKTSIVWFLNNLINDMIKRNTNPIGSKGK